MNDEKELDLLPFETNLSCVEKLVLFPNSPVC